MGVKRKRHSAEFKAKVAMEACSGLKTINELASIYEVLRFRSVDGRLSSEKELRESFPKAVREMPKKRGN